MIMSPEMMFDLVIIDLRGRRVQDFAPHLFLLGVRLFHLSRDEFSKCVANGGVNQLVLNDRIMLNWTHARCYP